MRRHRLSRRGNRLMSKFLHVAARTQIRLPKPGLTYHERKVAEGRSPWRCSGRSSDSSPTSSTARCSQTTKQEWSGVDSGDETEVP